ncbi:MAG: polysaccharide deacetylase family protein [Acidimicrobiaceae bacterium]|nr:polysaccharide deacetylase family protein [Acidimicrobiaceae bacterium]
MAAYVAGYDVEAVYAWWDSDHTEHTGDNYDDVVSYEGERLTDCLAGVRAVADVHLQRQAPATFFIVARLLEAARSELVEILDHPIFEIASHSYTHPDIKAYLHDDHRLRHEIVDSKTAIEDAFGREVLGFTTPGGYEYGYIGEPKVLEILQGAGYRYLRSVGTGPHYSMPAPLHQPFTYDAEGCGDLLEIPTHAWHDNVLTGQHGLVSWPPTLPWDYPTKMPTDAQGVYEAYAPGIEHAVRAGLLTYVPTFHPWSIYRVDERASHIGMLLDHADGVLDICSCVQVYEQVRDDPQLASARPLIPLAG